MNVVLAADLLFKGLEAYGRFAASIRKANEEGRTSLSKEEVAEFRQFTAERADALQAEIDRQLGGEEGKPGEG